MRTKSEKKACPETHRNTKIPLKAGARITERLEKCQRFRKILTSSGSAAHFVLRRSEHLLDLVASIDVQSYVVCRDYDGGGYGEEIKQLPEDVRILERSAEQQQNLEGGARNDGGSGGGNVLSEVVRRDSVHVNRVECKTKSQSLM